MRNRPLLLAHRGARACPCATENTLASFDLALQHGCDGFEFDVRLTGCGRALICHDEKVNGITVARAHAGQLRDLPVLEDVLEDYGQRAFLDIELKVQGLERKVLAGLRDYPPERDFVISSFLPSVVMELKARKEVIPLGIICDSKSQLSTGVAMPVDYAVIHESLLTEKVLEQIRRADKKIIVWTVNDADSMQRFAAWNVDAIISDDTRLLVKTLRPDPAGC